MSFIRLFSITIVISVIGISHQRAVVTKWNIYPNDRPIIGILAQEFHSNTTNITSDKNQSYIAASYVKFVEAGGARVVPILLNQTVDQLTELLGFLNGVLIPGGGASLDPTLDTSYYAKSGKIILDYAMTVNGKNDYFPVWGTCLGFELMATHFAGNTDVLVDCSASDVALPLNISSGATSGRLFSELPTDVYQSLLNDNVTANFHKKCLTPEGVKNSGLDKYFNVLSTNFDVNGLEFVSTFEGTSYPFYGVQWHPEKTAWEWSTSEVNIPHSPEAIRVTQYFASFFANEARKNVHKYKNPAREMSELIYQINPFYSARTGSNFEQIYEFSLKNGPSKKSKKKQEAIPVRQVEELRIQSSGSSNFSSFADKRLQLVIVLLLYVTQNIYSKP